jgi:hypothetical protein
VGEGAAPSRRRKALILLAVILLLAGAIAGLLYRIQPVKEPYFLGLWIDQTDDPLIPFSPWAEAERAALLEIGWPEKDGFGRQELTLLRDELKSLEKRSRRPVVVYLRAQALVDEGGEVFLLPGDARLAEPRTWLPLRDVFGYLHACPARQKLLILDLGRPFAVPRAGLLRTDVLEQAHKVVQQAVADTPHLLVLTACASGQVPYTLDDMARSAFGYYLEQGLHGHADGYNEKHRYDGRIAARELAAFVAARVDRWSRMNRPARQTPQLLASPDAGDFILTTALATDPPEEAPERPKYPAWLNEGWRLLDEWRANPAYRTPVARYRELESALLAAEQRWRGGVVGEHSPRELTESVAKFLRDRDQLRLAENDAPPRSVAEAVERSRKAREAAAVQAAKETPPAGAKPEGKAGAVSSADVVEKLRELADLNARLTSAAKPDEKDAARLTADREALLKASATAPWELVQGICETAESSRPRWDQIQLWNGLLVKMWPSLQPSPPRLERIETLHRLASLPKEGWQAEAVQLALQAARAKDATATCDPAFLPWVKEPLAAAAKAMQAAMESLGSAEPDARATAAKRFEEALQGYNRANRHIQTLESAQRWRDEAMARLPGLALYLEDAPERLTDWLATMRAARRLQNLLEAPPGRNAPELADVLGELDEQTRRIEKGLNRLPPHIAQDRLKGMLDQTGRPTVAAWRELDALLAGPATEAAQREQVWNASCRLSTRLLQLTLTEDLADHRLSRLTPAPGEVRANEASAASRARALQRAQLSLGLLELDAAVDTRTLETTLQRALGGDEKARESIGRILKTAWQEALAPARR